MVDNTPWADLRQSDPDVNEISAAVSETPCSDTESKVPPTNQTSQPPLATINDCRPDKKRKAPADNFESGSKSLGRTKKQRKPDINASSDSDVDMVDTADLGDDYDEELDLVGGQSISALQARRMR